MTDKTIWVIADDRAGNVVQALGVAEAIGGQIETKNIRYTKFVKLPNFLRGSSTLGVTSQSVKDIQGSYPDIAIAAGRRAAPFLRYIKKKSGGKTKIVQLMYPGGFGLSDYDLIVLPKHDGFTAERSNVMRITGAPNRITPQRLEVEKEKWAKVFDTLPKPKIALIIGGATKDKPFTVQMAQDLSLRSKVLAENLDGASFLVTTSRRTGLEQEKIIHASLPEPMFFYEWGNKEYENPYFGLLACADYIIVTGDSVSMCTEACSTPAPVYIYAPEGTVGKKHARLHQELYEGGYAVPLDENPQPITAEHHPLRETLAVAKRILEL